VGNTELSASTANARELARVLKLIGPATAVIIILVAAWFLHRELASLSWSDVATNIRSHSGLRIFFACCCATAGYAVLTAYDALAMRYIRRPVPYVKTAATAFIAFAVAHNVGISAISGGSIRYRIYAATGLSASEIAKVIAFCSATFAVGAVFLIGTALLYLPSTEIGLIGLPSGSAYPLGIVGLALVGGYVFSPLIRTSPIRLGNWQTDFPRISITTGQLLVSVADLSLAAATLYVLLAPALEMTFPAFVGIYLIAVTAGLVSSVPGGLGVFEATLLLAFPDIDRALLLSTIVIYRLIYYVAPLAVALGLLIGSEIRLRSEHLTTAGRLAMTGLGLVSPSAFGTLTFIAGIVLLISGATPAIDSRLATIGRFIPHPLLEVSHLAASVLGFFLLVIARGLFSRLRGAVHLALGVLAAGALASLLKGLDYEEALTLTAIAAALWLARGAFDRRGSLAAQRITAGGVIAVATVLTSAALIAMLAYRDVAYTDELIWQFSVDGDAPRTLRALIVVTVSALGFGLWQLMIPRPPVSPPMRTADHDVVRRIVASAPDPLANAVLIGDKRLLFDSERTAFIMYQIRGRSWIALGEPVGPRELHESLAWQFLELCDRHNGRPAFYEVPHANAALYVDLGLSLWKLGEEGRVYVPDFSLEGPARAELRHARNRALRSGASFAVIPRHQLPPLMSQLRAISAAWLRRRHAAEKGFSLGSFSEEYLSNFDCAVIRVDDRIIAFANIWPCAASRELTIDLMRYDDRAPNGTMDYLFVELIAWARDHGYEWFGLGMAPLSGLDKHPLAPMWQKVGNAIFRYADEYYNFDGLRAYKQKFGPLWAPRYLACPAGLTFPRVLFDATVLVAGGLGSVFRK